MKIKYEFATGEEVEIEVSEEISEISIQIDKKIHNSDRRETRRHNSYGDCNDKQKILRDASVDVEKEVFSNLEFETLDKAITKLQPQQQELVRKVFFEERTMADIAREEGISAKAIQSRVNKIKIRLIKIIKNNLF